MAEEEKALTHVEVNQTTEPATKARFMLVPLIIMVLSMVGFMFWTGNGVLSEGSGSKSVLYATALATAIAYGLRKR